MKITVLFGGPSAEREISLISGQAVIDGLRSMGHDVTGSDISPDDLSGLQKPADVIFPVLHGAFGESGELQEILEQRNLPFVGSGSAASRIGINKILTKQTWERAGLPTPPYEMIASADSARLGPPCVVKAIDSGSSIDVYICKTPAEAAEACRKVIARHGRALVEKFIEGAELTVGILEEQPLAPIRVVTTRQFYDFEAKYKGNYTDYRFELGLPASVTPQARELARQAHAAIGCRDLSRVDMMLDNENRPYLLEINTLPGFTPRSLLPKAARQAGIEFGPLVDRLARRAYERHRAAA
jgi:D-alanine-D-alanine ligase